MAKSTFNMGKIELENILRAVERRARTKPAITSRSMVKVLGELIDSAYKEGYDEGVEQGEADGFVRGFERAEKTMSKNIARNRGYGGRRGR